MNNIITNQLATIDLDQLSTVNGGFDMGRMIEAGNRTAPAGREAGKYLGPAVGAGIGAVTGGVPGAIGGAAAGTALGPAVGGGLGWAAGAGQDAYNQLSGR
jgi:hypothetical protein